MFSESGKVIVTHHFSYILNCVASAAQQFGCTFQTYAPDKFADGEISECLYPAVEGGLTDDHNVCQLFHVEIGVFHVFIDNSHDFYDETGLRENEALLLLFFLPVMLPARRWE